MDTAFVTKCLYCPNLDDDPLGEYVVVVDVVEIFSRPNTVNEKPSKSVGDEEVLDEIHLLNRANAEFIAIVHNLMPEILERLRAI